MKSFKTKAIMENLDYMIDFVLDNVSTFSGGNKKLENQVRLVCEEAFVNIINYAYPNGNGDIEILYDEDETNNKFSITSIDEGIDFNPLEKEDPDINLPMEDRAIGGLGIFMIKQVMTNVNFNRKDGKNIFYMDKNI